MDELGPEDKALFGALHAEDEPTSHDRARVRARVVAAIAATSSIAAVGAAAGAGAAATTTKGVAAASWYMGAWKIGAAVVVLGLASGAGYYAVAHRSEATPVVAAAAATGVEPLASASATPSVAKGEGAEMPNGPTSAADIASAHAEPAPVQAKASVRSADPKAHGARTDDLEAEVALLATAQRALARHTPAAALAALDEHARTFPRGALATEREGLRAVGACDAKHGDGRARADTFVARHPTSPLVARVKAACGLP